MTAALELRGIEIARLVALAGAETAVATPQDRLPFDGAGPALNSERWLDLGRQMRLHESCADPQLVRLRDAFALSPAEYWLVMLCGAAERFPEVAAALGILMDQQQAHLLTPSSFAQLMHAARGVPLDEALCLALDGGVPARLGLLQVADTPGRPLTHQTIRLAPAELAAALGRYPVANAAHDGDCPAADRRPVFEAGLLAVAASLLESNRLICLRGGSPRALLQFADDLGATLGLPTRTFTAGEGPLSLTPLLRVRDALPVLDLTGAGAQAASGRTMLREARSLVWRLVVLAGDGFAESEIPAIDVPRFTGREAECIWRSATGDASLAQRLAARFRVSTHEAAAACRHADQVAAAQNGQAATRERLIAQQVLQDGARRMGRLVTHLKSQAVLADLVVPDGLRGQLDDIVNWQRSSARVFGEMGLGQRTPLGRSLTCLFSGPPGTGKTFAAQCLANELGLNLYRIDLSQVVSKYIGETEKALATVFDEAESGHGVLLFDEADALFGKRSEVKDAHDRYANIEVGFLLQRIESCTEGGVSILATNLRANLDAAFLRRMRFVLDFPMPDAPMRKRLWEQSLPAPRFRAPDVDVEAFVERFRLSGGSIQNIGLAAAHMAAASTEGRVTVGHLTRATYRELEKSGQSRDRASFGPLAEFLPAEAI